MELLIKTWPQLLKIWQGILPSMLVGLFLGNYLKLGNFSTKIEKLVTPLTVFSRLPLNCSLPIALCFLDRVIGFTLFQELRKEKKIGEKEILISAITAKIIMAFYPLTFLLLPLLLSTLGLGHGLKFFLLYASIFLLTSLTGVFWGHLSLESKNREQNRVIINPIEKNYSKNMIQRIKIALEKTIIPFINMATVFICFSFLALYLVEIGFIENIVSQFRFILDFLGLSPSATTLLALTTGTLSMLAAIASIGSAFQADLVSFQQLTTTLLLAAFLHNLYELFSYDLPINASIFGSKLGTKIALTTFFIHQSFIFLVLALIVILK